MSNRVSHEDGGAIIGCRSSVESRACLRRPPTLSTPWSSRNGLRECRDLGGEVQSLHCAKPEQQCVIDLGRLQCKCGSAGSGATPTQAPARDSEEPVQGGKPEKHLGFLLDFLGGDVCRDSLLGQIGVGHHKVSARPVSSVLAEPGGSSPPQGMLQQFARGDSSGGAVRWVVPPGDVSPLSVRQPLLNACHAVRHVGLPAGSVSLNPLQGDLRVGPKKRGCCEQTQSGTSVICERREQVGGGELESWQCHLPDRGHPALCGQ
ncbi:uncharacterized protein LOC143907541 [Temnothorax americanus]|uniref:uncharacterized protein LOC143907541 n=1 Tax=Temnothorax americanus TaxID=1964332 RepID=UPI00406936FA